jgi:hypothetical protein
MGHVAKDIYLLLSAVNACKKIRVMQKIQDKQTLKKQSVDH